MASLLNSTRLSKEEIIPVLSKNFLRINQGTLPSLFYEVIIILLLKSSRDGTTSVFIADKDKYFTAIDFSFSCQKKHSELTCLFGKNYS